MSKKPKGLIRPDNILSHFCYRGAHEFPERDVKYRCKGRNCLCVCHGKEMVNTTQMEKFNDSLLFDWKLWKDGYGVEP